VGAEDDFLASVLAETGEGDEDDGDVSTDVLRSRKKKRKGGLMAAVLHGTMDEARQACVASAPCAFNAAPTMLAGGGAW
jgi:hydroxypyruvate isomerase